MAQVLRGAPAAEPVPFLSETFKSLNNSHKIQSMEPVSIAALSLSGVVLLFELGKASRKLYLYRTRPLRSSSPRLQASSTNSFRTL